MFSTGKSQKNMESYFGKRIGERKSPSDKEKPVKNHLNNNNNNVRF